MTRKNQKAKAIAAKENSRLISFNALLVTVTVLGGFFIALNLAS